MLKAVLHALSSSTYAKTPLLAGMVQLEWKDTLWIAALIRGHKNPENIIRMPAGHIIRIVPTHELSDTGTGDLTPST